MITITRALAKDLYSVLRRSFQITPRRGDFPVHFVSSGEGLTITAGASGMVIQYQLVAEPSPAAELCVPLSLLKACQGASADTVTMCRQEDHVVARWLDLTLPRSVPFPAPTTAALPEIGAAVDVRLNGSELLSALREAVATTDPDSLRYALGMLQLRGRDGTLLATDGRQALVQRGFNFGWEEAVLVPASPVFACRELAAHTPVAVGKTNDHIVIRLGAWTIQLAIDKERRFPRIDDLLPSPAAARSRLQLTGSDAEFAAATLQRLPAQDEPNDPLTLDLNGSVILRLGSRAGLPPTEAVLVNSKKEGEDIRLAMNRKYFTRAARLGFRELYIQDARSPVLAADDRRSFLWAVLDPSAVIAQAREACTASSPINRPPRRAGRLRRKPLVNAA